MLKELLTMTILPILLFSLSSAYVVDEQKGVVAIGSEEYILEKVEAEKYETIIHDEEGIVELEPFRPRGLSPKKSKLETSAERGKLAGKIRVDKEAGKYTKDTIIPIRVVLNFDEDVEERFEKEFEGLFGDTLKYKKKQYRKYDLEVNVEQLDLLVEMDEVLFIIEPSNERIFSADFASGGDVTINMNAASEMLGVKKARKDFGVTGDLDGNEM